MINDPWWAIRAALLSLDLVCIGMGLLVPWHFRYLARHGLTLWRRETDEATNLYLGLGIFLCALGLSLSRLKTIGPELTALYEGIPLRHSWWQLLDAWRLLAILGYWLHLWALLRTGHWLPRLLRWAIPIAWTVTTLLLWHMGRSAYEMLINFWMIYP